MSDGICSHCPSEQPCHTGPTRGLGVQVCGLLDHQLDDRVLVMQVMDALGKGLSPGARQALVVWLGGCAGWVFSMVVLGGMTRLTRSGLSMTDWKFTGERAPRTQVEPLLFQVTHDLTGHISG